MSSNKVICVIDYKGGGNLYGLMNSLNQVGADVILSSSPEDIARATKIIFPGVGHFHNALKQLSVLGLKDIIIEKAQSGIPFMGICVGMQLLCRSSEEVLEDGTNSLSIAGLGLVPIDILRFSSDDSSYKIPHMGWNNIKVFGSKNQQSVNPILQGIDLNQDVYYVHSYCAGLDDSRYAEIQKYNPQVEIISSNYAGIDFIGHYWDGNNLFACQFHPEKSGGIGLTILRNFVNL